MPNKNNITTIVLELIFYENKVLLKDKIQRLSDSFINKKKENTFSIS